MKEEITLKIIEYIEGTLSYQESLEIKELMRGNPDLQKEFETFKTIFEDIENQEEKSPIPEVKINFLKDVEAEKKKINSQKNRIGLNLHKKEAFVILGIAASLALIVMISEFRTINFSLFKNGEELTFDGDLEKRSIIHEMKNNSVASERLLAVNSASQMPIDEGLVKSFLEVIMEDNNQNVRIAALKAVQTEKENPKVKEVIFKLTIDHTDPLIQIYAMDYIRKLEDKTSHKILSELIMNEATLEIVREEAQIILFEKEFTYNKS